MAVRKLNPVSAGTRHAVVADYSGLSGVRPEKSLVAKKSKSGGRNNTGKMTMRYVGGGHKQQYRIIDFKRNKFDIPGTVKTLEYDPNRSAHIALVVYADGEKTYILAPAGLQVGQKIMNGPKAPIEVGNALPLANIPLGTIIHNIEMKPGRGAQIVRSAGTFAQLAAKDGKYAVIKMPSGETRMILIECIATIGSVGNSEHNLLVKGKAGKSRWAGRRPRTRPVAMNPVDHPMGGGEGRSSGGHPRSRKGIPSKGYKTRKPKNPTSKLIIERRKK